MQLLICSSTYAESVHSITTDNGLGFVEHKSIAEAPYIDFYFAHPYVLWKCGLNENFNGLLRRTSRKVLIYA